MNRRLRNRIICLNSLIKYLKDNNYITETAQDVIKATQPDDSGEIIEAFLKGPSKAKYSPTLRSFALTLHFYSAKAYNFVRQKFNKTLPHPRTISKWFQSINGSPGFTEEAKKALELKVLEAEKKGKKVLCNFTYDEMHIKKAIQWCGNKFYGYVNVGTGINSDQLTAAKEALVFMLVSENDHWKIPFGYFLIDGLASSEKANLILKGLEFVCSTGIIVTSLTFDGLAANISTANILGANINDPIELKTWFKNPITEDKIFIFFDGCHMLKLIRNCLGTYKLLRNGIDETVDWGFLEKLVSLQEEEGLAMGTKIRRRHLDWKDQPMKVNLAAQTFSRSVSDALLCLEFDHKFPEFIGASATGEFIKNMNDLFDILNSKNRLCKVALRRGISVDNKEHIFQRLLEIKEYILSLNCMNTTSVLQCRRKTGFIGFLVCIESLMGFFEEFIEDKQWLDYIITYKLSQDHIELFFSALRSRLGRNNNPTAKEFERCYKRLIVHTEISPSITANVISLDSTTILHCSSGNNITRCADGENFEEDEVNIDNFNTFLHDHDYLEPQSWLLTDYTRDVISYIAGFVVRSIKKHITCDECLHILMSNEVHSQLQIRKAYGQLYKASNFAIKLCNEGEQIVRYLIASQQLFLLDDKSFDRIILVAIRKLPQDIFSVFGNHIFDGDVWDNHSGQLCKLVLRKYIGIRCYHEASKLSYHRTVRQKLTKTIIFHND